MAHAERQVEHDEQKDYGSAGQSCNVVLSTMTLQQARTEGNFVRYLKVRRKVIKMKNEVIL